MSGEGLSIFISGAQSTGKTTLQKDLHAVMKGSEAVDEVATEVIKALGLEREQFHWRDHPDVFTWLQEQILISQDEKEISNSGKEIDCIYDRGGLDPVVYVLTYIGKQEAERLLATPAGKRCCERYRSRTCLTFILEPQIECIQDDGFRICATLDELHGYTKRMKDLMRELSIPFHVIRELDREARTDFIVETSQSYADKQMQDKYM